MEELRAFRARPVITKHLEWTYIVGPTATIGALDDLGRMVRDPVEKRGASVNLFGRLVVEAYQRVIESEEAGIELHRMAEAYRCKMALMVQPSHRTS